METEKKPLVQVKNLKKYFNTGHKEVVKALDNVSFDIYEGETVGLVGESGCGKTTCGRIILGLYDKTDGQVLYRGKDVHQMSRSEKYAFKKQAQIVFQDPYSSLDPRMTVADIIAEGIDIHHLAKDRKERLQKIYYYLNAVGLNESHASRFVHEFSGGQRQRIGIARSLAVHPKFVVCDEAVSALDVSIQSQIINLLQDLKEQQHLTYLFITHDLSVVKYISDRIGVMYLGNLVELADSQEIFDHPMHPYTEALLESIPTTEEKRDLAVLEGDIPSPVNPPKGCKFHTRCKYCTEICTHVVPDWEEVTPNHFVACHHKLHTNE